MRHRQFERLIEGGFGINALVEQVQSGEAVGSFVFLIRDQALGDWTDLSVNLAAGARWASSFLSTRGRDPVSHSGWTAYETYYHLYGGMLGNPPPPAFFGVQPAGRQLGWAVCRELYDLTEVGESSLRDHWRILAVPVESALRIVSASQTSDEVVEAFVDPDDFDELLRDFVAWVATWCSSSEKVRPA